MALPIYNSIFGDNKNDNKTEKKSSFLSRDEERAYKDDTCPFHHLARIVKKNYYTEKTVKKIQILYLFAALIWILLVAWLIRTTPDVATWGLILLPLIIFGINFYYVGTCTFEAEEEMFTGNFLSFAFLIAALLISWTKLGAAEKYFRILAISIILIMLSLIDIWIPKDKWVIYKHFRTILHTSALTLLSLALYLYYRDMVTSKSNQILVNNNLAKNIV